MEVPANPPPVRLGLMQRPAHWRAAEACSVYASKPEAAAELLDATSPLVPLDLIFLRAGRVIAMRRRQPPARASACPKLSLPGRDRPYVEH